MYLYGWTVKHLTNDEGRVTLCGLSTEESALLSEDRVQGLTVALEMPLCKRCAKKANVVV